MRQSNTGKTPKVFGTSYVPPKRTNLQKERRISVGWRPIVSIFLIVVLLMVMTKLPFFRIKQVHIEGVDNASLSQELQSLAGQSIFSSAINRATDRWLREERSLATLICHRGLPNSLSCQATMRLPAVVWQQNGREFLVDEDGVLYAEKSGQPLDVPIVEDRLNTEISLGSQVASHEVVDQILRLDKSLADQKVTVGRLFVADSLYQLGAVITSFAGQNGEAVQKELTALFISTQPIDSQVKVLGTLLKERGQGIKERVDLRNPGYVYYK